MSFDEFFVQGLRDAERRLPLLKPLVPSDQAAILMLARSSQLFRFMDRAIDRLALACATSAVVQAVRRVWTGADSSQRRLLIGVALIVAAAVHVGLLAWHEPPPSWFWLILPAFAVASGGLLVAFSAAEHQEHV